MVIVVHIVANHLETSGTLPEFCLLSILCPESRKLVTIPGIGQLTHIKSVQKSIKKRLPLYLTVLRTCSILPVISLPKMPKLLLLYCGTYRLYERSPISLPASMTSSHQYLLKPLLVLFIVILIVHVTM